MVCSVSKLWALGGCSEPIILVFVGFRHGHGFKFLETVLSFASRVRTCCNHSMAPHFAGKCGSALILAVTCWHQSAEGSQWLGCGTDFEIFSLRFRSYR